ncbi:MAG TPA: outer membrane beta-barrel protein [Pyrinomonadaceae bacterium]|jgi:opacity protein-like surface antigen
MNTLIKILISTCVLCAGVFAQTNGDEYKKNEFYVGYSNQQIDRGNYRTANGVEAAYVRNIHRYFGIKADFSGAFRSDEFQVSSSDTINGNYSYRGKGNNSYYNFLGGVQVKNNVSRARFKPFAHALAGVAVTRSKNDALTCVSGTCPTFITNSVPFTFNNTNFAMALGGGLDIKINDKIDFRAIQVDYNPIFRGGFRQDNIRFGIGFVIK